MMISLYLTVNMTSRKAGYNNSNVQSEENTRVVEVSSWQAAYTVGGASLRVADVKADNADFSNWK